MLGLAPRRRPSANHQDKWSHVALFPLLRSIPIRVSSSEAVTLRMHSERQYCGIFSGRRRDEFELTKMR